MQLLKLCKWGMQASSKHFDGNPSIVYTHLRNGIMPFTTPGHLPSVNQEQHALDSAKMLFLPSQCARQKDPLERAFLHIAVSRERKLNEPVSRDESNLVSMPILCC